MAKFFPSLQEIKAYEICKPTAGELQLLHILSALDDSYNVYYNPYIAPNLEDVIVVMSERLGVLLIRTVDRDVLQMYASPKLKIPSPFEEVKAVYNHLFKQFPPLCEQFLRTSKSCYRALVKQYVFFSDCSDDDIKNMKFQSVDYVDHWSRVNASSIIHTIQSRYQTEFPPQLQTDFHALFAPSVEMAEQHSSFQLTEKQQELSEYRANRPRVTKIRGIAGSGKTLVIAQKAINHFCNTRKPVLILTYNITLREYIRAQIIRNAPDICHQPGCFEILHFDSLLKKLFRAVGKSVSVHIDGDTNDRSIYYKKCIDDLECTMSQDETLRGKVPYYETILIDEAQDYHKAWIKFIQDVLLAPSGQMTVCADEKQCIYKNRLEIEEMEGKKVPYIPNCPGRWNELNQSFRMTAANAELAIAFQRAFLPKYEIDEHEENARQVDLSSFISERLYYEIPDGTPSQIAAAIVRIIREYKQTRNKAPNDICVISKKFNILRLIDQELLSVYGVPTTRIFESEEVNIALRQNYSGKDLQDKLRALRKGYKLHFKMNCNTLKLCSTQSFKGWEIDTAILIITPSNADESENEDELIYTAITRAKNNLIIINIGNQKYRKFFTQSELGITQIKTPSL